MVTPDGRYLFFSRTYGGGTWATTTEADVFWVDMAVVERFSRCCACPADRLRLG